MLRNIIWDVDGTLLDTYPAMARSFQLAARDLGCDAPFDWIMQAAKISVGHCTAALAARCQLGGDDLAQGFNAYYDQVSLAEQPPFPGVLDILDYIIGLGGKNVIVTHRGAKGTAALLTAHHLAGYFSGWITRDDGYPKKPDPAAFVAALRTHQLAPAETLAIGDRDIDILAGEAAGLRTCLFDPQSPATADILINSYEDLYGYLTANPDAFDNGRSGE